MATPTRSVIRSTEPLSGGYGLLRLVPAAVASIAFHAGLVALFLFVLEGPGLGTLELENRDRLLENRIRSDLSATRVKDLMPPQPDLSATELRPKLNPKSDIKDKVAVPGTADPLEKAGIKSGDKDLPPVNIPKSKGFNTPKTGNSETPQPGPGGGKAGLPPGIDPNAIGKFTGGHWGRSSAQREALVKDYGGTTRSELAVNKGLEFLAHFQQKGAWQFTDPRLDNKFSVSVPEDDVAASSLALLAFLARGCTQEPAVDNGSNGMEPNPYAKHVDAAVEFLRRKQNPKTGLIGVKELANREIYDVHCLATLALCELYGMTRNEAFKAGLRPTVRKAVQLLIEKQLDDGGWNSKLDKRVNADGDIVVTGWAIQALKSATFADLDVPRGALEKASRFVDKVADAKTEGYHYSGYRLNAPVKATNSVVGLLCRMHLSGWNAGNARLLRGVDTWILSPPKSDEEARERNGVVYKFYATQVMFHLGGECWQRWNAEARDRLLADQVVADARTPSLAGSWNPPSATDDADGHVGGRLLCTSLTLLNLEVYYRQLPLHLARR